MVKVNANSANCELVACNRRDELLNVPQIVITREFSRETMYNNQETIQSKASIASARRLMQLLKVVESRRCERNRKESEQLSYLGTILPSQGKPQQKTSYLRQKVAVYGFLHRPRGWIALIYHVLVFVMVFTCLIVTILSTIREFHLTAWKFLLYFEIFMLVWFSGEYVVRFWASSCKRKYYGCRGKLRFFMSPFRIVDLIVIILSAFILWFSPKDGHILFAASAFRGFHRSLQVMELIRLQRRFHPWRILSSVIYSQREQLIITTYIGILAITFMAFFLYMIESDVKNFDNVGEALWWAVVTLCTIGYGDKVPVTWLGKLIASIFTIIGVSIFALPAGIIGTGLALKVQEEQRRRQKKKKKVPAAVLIQCFWRWYAASTYSVAIWSRYRSPICLLSEAEKNAIRFIHNIKLSIAKREFKLLLKPIDIRDVLEQYEHGHNDILVRLKNLQFGLVSILGTVDNNAQRMHESRISLASRVVLVEDVVKRLEAQMKEQNEILLKILDNSSQSRI